MSPLAWTLATLLMLYLVVVEPVWGTWEYRRLKERRSSDEHALLRVYHLAVVVEWAWVAYLSLVVAVAGVAVEQLVAPPAGLVVADAIVSIAPGLIGGLAIGLVATAVVARRAKPGETTTGVGDFAALLPATSQERRWSAIVAMTAGICEELVFRGFVIYYLVNLVPQADALVVIALAAAVFSVAHAYQGLAGVAATFALGLAFGMIYVATGSLVPGMVLHALTDLRALLFAPRANQPVSQARPPG